MEKFINLDGSSICYTLTYKKVKHITLRVKAGGSVFVTAPVRTSVKDIENFISSKSNWLTSGVARLSKVTALEDIPVCLHTPAQCDEIILPYLKKYFPLFSETIGCTPTIKYRSMKTKWGICRPTLKTITFNKRLIDKPADAIEYVVLHEYIHFWHPNHGKGFYAELARLMPDYKEREKLLKSMHE